MPPSRTHVACEYFLVLYMPAWAAILAFYVGASTMGSFLLAVSLTTIAVLGIAPSQAYVTLNALCMEIAIFAVMLTIPRKYLDECLTKDSESGIGNSTRLNQTSNCNLPPIPMIGFGEGIGIFISSYLFYLIFLYGILSIRGLSTAQMGSLGEIIGNFQELYRRECPQQQPEVVFDVAQPVNSEANDETDVSQNVNGSPGSTGNQVA